MAKTKKLNQVLKAEQDLKAHKFGELSAIYKTFQKPALFEGMNRTYAPLKDDGEQLPPETVHVQQHVQKLLSTIRSGLITIIDIEATKDEANTKARASVEVDGATLLENAPATFLLALEKQLRDLRAEVDKLPTLDPSEVWTYDQEAALYKTAPSAKVRTKKESHVLVKFQPTETQPGQADTITEDRVVGTFLLTKASGAVSATDKARYLERIDKLAVAVKQAKEEANLQSVEEVSVGQKLLDFVFAA